MKEPLLGVEREDCSQLNVIVCVEKNVEKFRDGVTQVIHFQFNDNTTINMSFLLQMELLGDAHERVARRWCQYEQTLSSATVTYPCQPYYGSCTYGVQGIRLVI